MPVVDVRQREQQVLGPDVLVAHQARFFLGEHHHAAGVVAEPLEHAVSLAALPDGASAGGASPELGVVRGDDGVDGPLAQVRPPRRR